jgi:hypothetical protein
MYMRRPLLYTGECSPCYFKRDQLIPGEQNLIMYILLLWNLFLSAERNMLERSFAHFHRTIEIFLITLQDVGTVLCTHYLHS